jgi:hypothetical protein
MILPRIAEAKRMTKSLLGWQGMYEQEKSQRELILPQHNAIK